MARTNLNEAGRQLEGEPYEGRDRRVSRSRHAGDLTWTAAAPRADEGGRTDVAPAADGGPAEAEAETQEKVRTRDERSQKTKSRHQAEERIQEAVNEAAAVAGETGGLGAPGRPVNRRFGSGNGSVFGSVSGARSNHSATGSITSNASSLRKRFADTLLRQNSNKDNDRPSVWRTLSKSSRSVATGEPMTSSSLSKVSLNRSRSIESPNRRPASRDRPTVMGAFDDRPSSSQGPVNRLSTIGASPPPDEKEATKSLKKKRRSSLSDLKSLMAQATLRGSSPSSPSPLRGLKFNSSPRTPSPTKIPVAGGIMDRNRPAVYSTGSPNQKENLPLNSSSSRDVGNLTERPHNIISNPDVVVVKDLWSGGAKSHQKTASLSSNIPTLRGRAPSASRPSSSPGKPSPQKLRLQSPAKLRERLQNEAKAISEAEASLQNELSKIGEEMAKLNASSGSPTRSSDIKKLAQAVAALESRIPEVIKDLNSRNDAVKAELEKSYQASEFKVKGLDQLYKESSAENELLYEKFNAELGKIVRALRGKGKEDKEELVAKVKDGSEETAKIKKENARLKRENLTLRTLLKGNDCSACTGAAALREGR